MKKYFIYTLIFSTLVLILSCIANFRGIFTSEKIFENNTQTTETKTQTETTVQNSLICENFLVMDKDTQIVTQVSAFDYVIGAVAAEMPAIFESEALKAQAVAAYTYAVRQKSIVSDETRKSLHGADFSNDSSLYQAFYDNDKIKEVYGDNYDKYYEKIKNAVSEVLGKVILYENEPIIAAFHSMSNGYTQSAEDVWGSSVAYLVSVESSSDKEANGYLSQVEYSKDEFKEIISKLSSDEKLDNNPENWLKISKKGDGNSVITVEIGNKTYSGEEIRSALGLRSATFEINYDSENEKFTINVYGYGHGVGMSQYGANEMAKNGSNWEEILSYYYPDTVIS